MYNNIDVKHKFASLYFSKSHLKPDIDKRDVTLRWSTSRNLQESNRKVSLRTHIHYILTGFNAY